MTFNLEHYARSILHERMTNPLLRKVVSIKPDRYSLCIAQAALMREAGTRMFKRVLAAMVLAGSFALLVGCTPSAEATQARINAAKAALQSSVGGVSTDWASKGNPLKSLPIKKSLPKKIGGMRIRSDVGVAFVLGTLEGMVVEALYGDRESGVRLLVVDLATAERLDEHAGPGTEYRGGRIVEYKSAGRHGLTYVSHGRFIVHLEATAVDLSVLRTALDEVAIEHLHQLTGTSLGQP